MSYTVSEAKELADIKEDNFKGITIFFNKAELDNELTSILNGFDKKILMKKATIEYITNCGRIKVNELKDVLIHNKYASNKLSTIIESRTSDYKMELIDNQGFSTNIALIEGYYNIQLKNTNKLCTSEIIISAEQLKMARFYFNK